MNNKNAETRNLPLLKVTDLQVHFETYHEIVYAVNGVSFSVDRGQTLGIVGESGCGKSVSALSVMGLVPSPPGQIMNGEILFDGRDLRKMSTSQLDEIRGNDISMVFQDPMSSLNPVMKIGDQIAESLVKHTGVSWKEARQQALDILDLVEIPSPKERLRQYPHEFSGGMRQRVMIGIALSCMPKLLIADEPTTALDVTIQAQILTLIKDLRARLGMALILITHDLGIIAGIAERVNVMYAGRIVESSILHNIFNNARHPYTQGLLNSIPRLDEKEQNRLKSIPGYPPMLSSPPTGCAFAPRCNLVEERCWVEVPVLETIKDNNGNNRDHYCACWVK
jgi:oligopeptide transport system ATP-binding protein